MVLKALQEEKKVEPALKVGVDYEIRKDEKGFLSCHSLKNKPKKEEAPKAEEKKEEKKKRK